MDLVIFFVFAENSSLQTALIPQPGLGDVRFRLDGKLIFTGGWDSK